jgi:hypothetical protein
MNQKYLIIGDQHNSGQKLEQFVQQYPKHTLIYMGDALDNFGDSAAEAAEVAEWLQYSLNQPNRIHLWGNHDIPYHYSNNGTYNCPGFTAGKNLAINSIMKPSDWDKLKFYHFDGNFWYSHAGFNLHHFPEMKQSMEYGVAQDILEDRFSKIFPVQDKTNPIIWEADQYRGGLSRYGGLLWQDWRALNSNGIPGINQIVGHTPVPEISFGYVPNKANANITHVNVDCGFKEVLEVDGKNLKVIKTGLKNFYRR